MSDRPDRSERHAERCRTFAERLIPLLRKRAEELGYALGVHGSLAYDIDLIAAPWRYEAVDAPELAEQLRQVAEREIGIAFQKPGEDTRHFHLGMPGFKPHGRLTWSFHLGGGPYIDLSVMAKFSVEYVIASDDGESNFLRRKP